MTSFRLFRAKIQTEQKTEATATSEIWLLYDLRMIARWTHMILTLQISSEQFLFCGLEVAASRSCASIV